MFKLQSPLEFPAYIEILLFMLVLVVVLLLLNFILVAAGQEETSLYKRYDSLSNLYIKLFSVILLITIVWIIVAAITAQL